MDIMNVFGMYHLAGVFTGSTDHHLPASPIVEDWLDHDNSESAMHGSADFPE